MSEHVFSPSTTMQKLFTRVQNLPSKLYLLADFSHHQLQRYLLEFKHLQGGAAWRNAYENNESGLHVKLNLY